MISILLPEVDAARLMKQISAHTAAEFGADCEPSGYEIVVAVHPAFGAEAVLRLGAHVIPLGKATVE
ncbi:hypothetical protein [Sphingomonas psychrolutea]|uniref:Uncharacterized protein n=1 Tax=Sphingomonas psychrolutea TaxID=1259676 RepID=A0ABQ1GW17_9SPHN|nr:hypothetical protein [Sphingomonas psychrolutea]GGA51511.1 hypothetical protein GCM10011395_22360 [Sphingomonas psychrolutea]